MVLGQTGALALSRHFPLRRFLTSQTLFFLAFAYIFNARVALRLLATLYVKLPTVLARKAFRCLMPRSVSGETVLITGAGSGIGRLMAMRFAALGAKIVLVDVSKEGIEKVKQELPASAPQVAAFECDISDRHKVYEMAEAVKRTVGDVTILINNAGIVGKGFCTEMSDEAMERIMHVNSTSHFWTTKAFLPAMLEKNHGHVVTVASLAGHFAVPGMTSYITSKFAAIGFASALRADILKLGKPGVKTTCVCPFYISTGMFQGVQGMASSKRFFQLLEPDDVAAKVVAAVRRGSASLYMPALARALIMLQSLFPEEINEEMNTITGLNSTMDTFQGRG